MMCLGANCMSQGVKLESDIPHELLQHLCVAFSDAENLVSPEAGHRTGMLLVVIEMQVLSCRGMHC